MRTLILVSLGAAVFTMSSFAFVTTTGDSGRVAAQIVTGIGFLGAGVILHSRRSVVGVTTAATIWVTASVGLTVGAGYAIPGIALSVVVFLEPFEPSSATTEPLGTVRETSATPMRSP